MNIKKLLGKRIQELRKARKLTQEYVAELIGIEGSSLSNIENGKYYPTAENLEKILNILNATPKQLFSFEQHQGNETLKAEVARILDEHPEHVQMIYKIVKSVVE